MKNILHILSGLMLCFSLYSCDEKEIGVDGEGAISLDIKVGLSVDVSAKAVQSDEELISNCSIGIWNSDGELYGTYKGLDAVQNLYLKSGDYKIVIEAGNKVSASFDDIYYKGEEEFNIKPNKTTPVSVNCKIYNTLVKVKFDSSLNAVFADYRAEIFVDQETKIEFTKGISGEEYIAYFTPTESASLAWAFYGTYANGTIWPEGGIIENVKPTTQYNLNFGLREDGPGEAKIKLTVDETTIDVEDEVQVPIRPRISGNGFNLNETQYLAENQQDAEFQISLVAYSGFEEAYVESSIFTSLGFGTSRFSILDLDDTERNDLATKGITVDYNLEESEVILTFNKNLFNQLVNGREDYAFNMYVEDRKGKSNGTVLSVSVCGWADVVQATVADVFAYSGTISGTYSTVGNFTPLVLYRQQGTTDWLKVEVVNGNGMVEAVDGNFTIKLENLHSATSYEYKAAVGRDIYVFTTGTAEQLPNHSFEKWDTSSKAYLIHAAGEEMFWDSGNHGSTTMGEDYNVTTPSTQYVNEGTYSAQLKSQFVGVLIFGKFAAGNLFAGKYISTDGTKGAIIDFGRPFTSRPTKLRGWLKYNAGTIDYVDSSLTTELKNEGAKKGEIDKAFIWVSLGYWGEPVRINSTNRPDGLYNHNTDDKNIAYGEYVQNGSTPGDGMIPFEITLDYKTYDHIPTHIIVVCSASKYGDYFTGSKSSTLWLDDFELIYE